MIRDRGRGRALAGAPAASHNAARNGSGHDEKGPAVGPVEIADTVATVSLADLLAATDDIADAGPLGALVVASYRADGVHRCPRCRRPSAAVLDSLRASCARCRWRGTRWAVARDVLADPASIRRMLRTREAAPW